MAASRSAGVGRSARTITASALAILVALPGQAHANADDDGRRGRSSRGNRDPVAAGQVIPSGTAASEEAAKAGLVPARYRRAQALFEAGVAAAVSRRWREAADAFEVSAGLVERPNTLFNLVLALIELKDALAAHRTLERFLEIAGDRNPADSAQARGLKAQLEKEVATLTVSFDPATAHVGVDDRATSPRTRRWVLKPGRHTVRAKAAGYRARDARVNLPAGEVTDLSLNLVPHAAPARTAVTPSMAAAQHAAVSADARLDVQRSPDDTTALHDEGGGLLTSPWFWLVVGAVAAGAAVVSVAMLSREDSDERPAYKGTIGVRL